MIPAKYKFAPRFLPTWYVSRPTIKLGIPIDKASAIAIRSLLLTRCWPSPLLRDGEVGFGVGVEVGVKLIIEVGVEVGFEVDELGTGAEDNDVGIDVGVDFEEDVDVDEDNIEGDGALKVDAKDAKDAEVVDFEEDAEFNAVDVDFDEDTSQDKGPISQDGLHTAAIKTWKKQWKANPDYLLTEDGSSGTDSCPDGSSKIGVSSCSNRTCENSPGFSAALDRSAAISNAISKTGLNICPIVRFSWLKLTRILRCGRWTRIQKSER